MEEEKVERRVRRGVKREAVTGGIKVNEKGKRQSEAARVEISLRVANDPDGRAATITR